MLFQGEGRFRRISDVRACWAPGKVRPLVSRQVVRESTYAYAAVAPAEGRMVTMLAPKCNTDGFDAFLRLVAEAISNRRIVMFLDGAGWHKAKRLKIPDGMRLEFLPPYTPECNPVEHVWDECVKNTSPTNSSRPFTMSKFVSKPDSTNSRRITPASNP